MAWSLLHPSILAACSISGEMLKNVPRSSQMVKAWLNAAFKKIKPMMLSVICSTIMTL